MSSGFSTATGEVLEQPIITNARHSRNRRSMGRMSVGSAASQKSFQNVTESLNVTKINKEITDTENSINALQRGIRDLELRRESRSQYETDDIFDEEYFMRHSRPRTYRPYFSLSFALVCFIMFLAEVGVNGWTIEDPKLNPLIGPSVDSLIKLGAKDTELLQKGEVYRLIAPIFLHVGIIHLMSNLLGVFLICLPMEQEFGTLRVAIIAIASGISGILLSALLAPNVVSVGASGAIFGLIGAGFADLFHNWKIYRGKNTGMLIQLSICTIINFFFGLMPFVDNFAHLGGFCVGLITGTVLLVKQYGEMSEVKSLKVTLRVLSVLVLPVIFAVMLFLLFFGFDVATNCKGCDYISCVPFPPGASKEDRWWDCSKCFNGFGEFVNFTAGGTVVVFCPNGDNFTANSPDGYDLEKFTQDFPFFCSEVCNE